jgi:hypothetical protein
MYHCLLTRKLLIEILQRGIKTKSELSFLIKLMQQMGPFLKNPDLLAGQNA